MMTSQMPCVTVRRSLAAIHHAFASTPHVPCVLLWVEEAANVFNTPKDAPCT